jgi:hypothetical protein
MAEHSEHKSGDHKPSHELSGLPRTVWHGLKVLGSELKWQCISIIRGLETRQMHKRLGREYQALGEMAYASITKTAEDKPMPHADVKMLSTVKQIDFLRDEIEHLKRESGRLRNEFVHNRSKSLGYK